MRQFTLVIRAVLANWLDEILLKKAQSAAEQVKTYEEEIRQVRLKQQALEESIKNDLAMLQAGG